MFIIIAFLVPFYQGLLVDSSSNPTDYESFNTLQTWVGGDSHGG